MPAPTHDQPLPTYDDALARVLGQVAQLDTETVDLAAALGRVLRRDVSADRDQPPFHRAAMDGFAVRSDAVTPGSTFAIVGEVPAGGELTTPVDAASQVVRIATGAALPAAYDAVVEVERAVVEGERVRFTVDGVAAGQHIHRRSRDAQAGDVVLRAGTLMGAQHVGIAAAVGAVALTVARRPRVTLLTTGDEVRDPATPTDALRPQQIRNSNGPMVAALVAQWGADLIEHAHVPDDPAATRDAAQRALARSDLVLTTGGVSVGGRDYLPGTWDALGLATLVHGVSIQPGKPLLAAQSAGGGPLVVGLPGNPVSVLTTAHLFVQPIVRRMLGRPAALPWRRAWLAEPVTPNRKRQAFRAARLVGETAEQVAVLPWQGSGDLAHTAAADGFVRLPVQAEAVEAGTAVAFLALEGR